MTNLLDVLKGFHRNLTSIEELKNITETPSNQELQAVANFMKGCHNNDIKDTAACKIIGVTEQTKSLSKNHYHILSLRYAQDFNGNNSIASEIQKYLNFANEQLNRYKVRKNIIPQDNSEQRLKQYREEKIDRLNSFFDMSWQKNEVSDIFKKCYDEYYAKVRTKILEMLQTDSERRINELYLQGVDIVRDFYNILGQKISNEYSIPDNYLSEYVHCSELKPFSVAYANLVEYIFEKRAECEISYIQMDCHIQPFEEECKELLEQQKQEVKSVICQKNWVSIYNILSTFKENIRSKFNTYKFYFNEVKRIGDFITTLIAYCKRKYKIEGTTLEEISQHIDKIDTNGEDNKSQDLKLLNVLLTLYKTFRNDLSSSCHSILIREINKYCYKLFWSLSDIIQDWKASDENEEQKVNELNGNFGTIFEYFRAGRISQNQMLDLLNVDANNLDNIKTASETLISYANGEMYLDPSVCGINCVYIMLDNPSRQYAYDFNETKECELDNTQKSRLIRFNLTSARIKEQFKNGYCNDGPCYNLYDFIIKDNDKTIIISVYLKQDIQNNFSLGVNIDRGAYHMRRFNYGGSAYMNFSDLPGANEIIDRYRNHSDLVRQDLILQIQNSLTDYLKHTNLRKGV